MNRGKWIIVLALMLLAAPACAEMFKYVDKDGNVLYTDDLSVVPEKQRPGVEVFESTLDQAVSTSEDKESEQEQTATTEKESSEELITRLEKQREALDQEAKALQAEMDALRFRAERT